jgi:biuret amidohydrolase
VSALLLIDLQVGLCSPDGVGAGPLSEVVAARGTLASAAKALGTAREAGAEVVHVRLGFDTAYRRRTNRTPRFDAHEQAGRFMEGSRDTELCPEVAPVSGELVLPKGSIGPFASTGLLAFLQARRISRLAVGGVATHLAVESAVREAADRGFQVAVLEEACAAPGSLHEHAISQILPAFAEILTLGDYAGWLEQK